MNIIELLMVYVYSVHEQSVNHRCTNSIPNVHILANNCSHAHLHYLYQFCSCMCVLYRESGNKTNWLHTAVWVDFAESELKLNFFIG